MTPELVRSYKSVFTECLTSLSDQQLPQITESLDTLADDTADLIQALDEGKRGLPAHWLNIFRFLKLGMVLEKTLKQSYDSIVGTYQTLSSRAERTADENNLLRESGDFLYAVDEITGDVDRLIPRIMQEIRAAMIRSYGIVLAPEEHIFADRIPERELMRLEGVLEQMTVLCEKMLEQIGVMHALVRIQKLILPE